MNIRALLCAAFGHPPVVTRCFGYHNCARCGAQIGDSLGGAFDGKGWAIVGCECDECKRSWKRARRIDKFLTPNPFKQ